MFRSKLLTEASVMLLLVVIVFFILFMLGCEKCLFRMKLISSFTNRGLALLTGVSSDVYVTVMLHTLDSVHSHSG